MKVLWIGSDREIVHMTVKILRRNRYNALPALGRDEAAALLVQNVFDLVVLDREMREDDCLNLMQLVKRGTAPPRLLLISPNREDEVPLLEAGADDWIQKPYQMNVLLARMAALLRQRHLKKTE